MKYVKQFLIIIGISLAGEILKYILPLPIPASIYGMAILFIALLTGIIKLKDVRETGKFLIEIMPLMFIPAGVGLMSSWGVLKPLLVPVSVITVVSLVVVMAAGGLVSQAVIRITIKKNGGVFYGKNSNIKFESKSRCKRKCRKCTRAIRDTDGYCDRYVFKTNIISRRNSLFCCIAKSS